MHSQSASHLLLVAMREEAQPLISGLGLVEIARPDPLRSLYRRGPLLLAVSGIGAHNMAAMAGLALREHPAIEAVANFGSAGAYAAARLPAGRLRCVEQVAKWDLQLPLSGMEKHHPPLRLSGGLPAEQGIPACRCNSGCSFSTREARERPDFPAAELEDMELYGLASFCSLLGLPLWSLKFVSNQVGDTALEEFSREFRTHLHAAADVCCGIAQRWIS
ncbi:MAG: hypothetical protein R3F46_08305 [bacterium]